MFTKVKQRTQLIYQFFEGAKLAFVLSILASLLTTGLNALTPQIFRFGVDSVIGGEERYAFLARHLWLLALAVILVALLSGLSQYVCRSSTARAGERFAKNMRDRLFVHIQRLPMFWQDANQTGDIIQRCTSDVGVIRDFVVTNLLEVFRTVFLIVISFAMMLSMNVKLSLLILPFVPVIIFYSAIFYQLVGSKFVAADEAEGELSTAVQENATGVRVIRAFGREKFEMDRFKEKNDGYARLWIRLCEILGLYWGVGDLITGLQVITVVVAGAYQAVHGHLTVGEFIAFASYNSSLTWPIRGLGRILSDMSKAGVSFDRIAYIIESEEEAYGSRERADKQVRANKQVMANEQVMADLKEEIGHNRKAGDKEEKGEWKAEAMGVVKNYDIAFHNLSFSYNEEHKVLKDINLSVPMGHTIGILGGTGSGKSTMMQLLMRLYEQKEGEGSITIGGRDIRSIPLEELRPMIGMVLQEPFLYSKTIRENIAAFRPDASLDEIREAAKIACIDEAIMAFPDGYDTLVGERGITLSGGQRQRVAIARMLMQKAPIMVFDDSLSAVDTETDYHIRQALKEKMKEATVFLISHRITSLMTADYILVMKDGRIVEEGSHKKLLAHKGIYHEIYDIQMNLDDRLEMES